MENVNQIINVDFFIPYNKQFGNVDMNWDVLINMKINKYLNATLNTMDTGWHKSSHIHSCCCLYHIHNVLATVLQIPENR